MSTFHEYGNFVKKGEVCSKIKLTKDIWILYKNQFYNKCGLNVKRKERHQRKRKVSWKKRRKKKKTPAISQLTDCKKTEENIFE